PNIAAFEREWSLESMEFRAWVALHETIHAFQMGRPWAHPHASALIREVAENMEFDLAGIEERLAGLDLSDPEKLSEALGGGDLFGQTTDPEQRLRVRRLQALMIAAEGHADHVLSVLGPRMLSSFARIDEALRRHHEERSEDERAIERMLAIDMRAEHYGLGRRFCDQVASQADERTLARMWESPESLPSMPELEEPTLWLSRMA
ncbi:MAG: zinc-dependent metalloprotease, partial [Actinomycetota bacterium]|nr:zinc-dependent metalloprotease [Actinomycetota bacterium]